MRSLWERACPRRGQYRHDKNQGITPPFVSQQEKFQASSCTTNIMVYHQTTRADNPHQEPPRSFGIRKIVTYSEETRSAGGTATDKPVTMVGLAVVIKNPWAGRGDGRQQG